MQLLMFYNIYRNIENIENYIFRLHIICIQIHIFLFIVYLIF